MITTSPRLNGGDENPDNTGFDHAPVIGPSMTSDAVMPESRKTPANVVVI
jgi:hypothetical protein